MYRCGQRGLEVLLVHPGGPFWKSKDLGAWSIPKGEIQPGKDTLAAARREFVEELGFAPEGYFTALSPVKQKGGKVIHAWAVKGDCDPAKCRSNTFQMEWPPRSGRLQEFPEVDQAAWFSVDEARNKINAAQAPLLDKLIGLTK
jgi:predicted NUDIX family NTP pyrophosphohydrolase